MKKASFECFFIEIIHFAGITLLDSAFPVAPRLPRLPDSKNAWRTSNCQRIDWSVSWFVVMCRSCISRDRGELHSLKKTSSLFPFFTVIIFMFQAKPICWRSYTNNLLTKTNLCLKYTWACESVPCNVVNWYDTSPVQTHDQSPRFPLPAGEKARWWRENAGSGCEIVGSQHFVLSGKVGIFFILTQIYQQWNERQAYCTDLLRFL